MIDRNFGHLPQIYKELPKEQMQELFDFRQKKFLHNIDTFYYSVKFQEDFRSDSRDPAVLRFRKFFQVKYDQLRFQSDSSDFRIPALGKYLVLKPVTFSRFYSVCLSNPEYFDIFLAPVVPKGSDGGESLTAECIVQIRSYMLWQFGAKDCFENSFEYIKQIASFFGLHIQNVQENRIDYCWHSNYLDDPESFFEPGNFYRMRVDRFKNATYVTNKVGEEDYEIDYVAMGKRSDKVFVRIYQKTREVVEQGYKPWFLQIWRMNGLISAYDQFVYEKAFEKRSWFYRFYARLEFYLKYGSDPVMLARCRGILDKTMEISEQELIRLADQLTPKLHTVINVEFQTMRRHSKSYELLPFKDNSDKGVCARIYDYFDNRDLIADYLTNKVFRLTVYDPDQRKSDRQMCPFWIALRRTKAIDVKRIRDKAHLIRSYNRRLSKEAVKKRFINAAVTYGLYARGSNQDNPLADAFEAMLVMNDNDLHNARAYKEKKLRQLNADELAEVFEGSGLHRFNFLDEYGEIYTYDSLVQRNMQEFSARNEGFYDCPDGF